MSGDGLKGIRLTSVVFALLPFYITIQISDHSRIIDVDRFEQRSHLAISRKSVSVGSSWPPAVLFTMCMLSNIQALPVLEEYSLAHMSARALAELSSCHAMSDNQVVSESLLTDRQHWTA